VTEIDPKLIQRVKAAKARRLASPVQYRDRSRVAFVVHSFNRLANVDQILAGLREIDDAELIVCDDGSLDGSRDRWASHLEQPNDFLILSNDIHEIRILDRAVRFASAEVVCLVQDDDAIPRESDWLEEALRQFDRYPKLAILGGFMGFHGFDPDPGRVTRIWDEGPFQFVEHVNIGPYFVRRSHYEALGGWDLSFSRPGEPGICFDNELCLRAWVRGFQVAYRFVPFKGPPQHYSRDGGTVLFSAKTRRRNQLRNERKIFEMYTPYARRISARTRKANREAAGHGSAAESPP